MTNHEFMNEGNVIIGRLGHGEDILAGLDNICREHEITCGWLYAIGAVQKARLGFYDQARRKYAFQELNKPLEITMLTGNVSLKEGRPMVHAHATLADENGACYGGHLGEGTIVFACEFKLQVLEGSVLKREYDEETGLALWDI
jgi:hypothetical protein